MFTANAAVASLHLKKQEIPPNAVVIFEDVGGYLGFHDGLLCTVNNDTNETNIVVFEKHWSLPNGTNIKNLPSTNRFGIETLDQGVSLYYRGHPPERGQFNCTLRYTTNIWSHDVLHDETSVYIVDMNFTHPTGQTVVIVGDDVELSVDVTIFPNDVPVPYQWQVNETDLTDNSTYQGTKTATLRIFNAQDDCKGRYRVSVAHSASGFTESIKLHVGKLKVVYSLPSKVYGVTFVHIYSCMIYCTYSHNQN